MKLGEKLRYLREVEGALRCVDRELSQQEVARLVEKELGKSISQSYLSQIESGARPHMSNSTRMLLARFFKVHPGYLVDDPEGFANELVSDVGVSEDKLDLWLV
jgi:transcriptional regulator with XRE-family HTH domain